MNSRKYIQEIYNVNNQINNVNLRNNLSESFERVIDKKFSKQLIK